MTISSIDELYIEGFLSYIDGKAYEFSDNVVITGENGAGKSTIFEAIMLSLGESSRYKNRLDKCINKKLDTAVLKLWSTLDTGNELFIETIIQREGRRQQKYVAIRKPGTKDVVEEYTNQAAIKFLEDNKFTEFANIAFVKQGGGSDLIHESPSQTFKNIRTLLALDFTSEFTNTAIDIKNTKESTDDLSKKLSECNGKIQSTEERLNAANAKIAQLSANLKDKEELESHISKLESELEELKTKRAEIISFNRDIEQKQRQLELIEKNISTTMTNKANIETRITNLNGSITQLTEELCSSLSRRDHTDLAEFKEKLASAQTELANIEKAITQANTEKKYAKDRLSLLMKGQCPTCGGAFSRSDIGSTQEKIDVIENGLTALTRQQTQAQTIIDEAIAAIKALEDKLSKAQSLSEKIENSKATIKDLEEQRVSYEKYIQEQTELKEKNFIETGTQKSDDYSSLIEEGQNDLRECTTELRKHDELKLLKENVETDNKYIDEVSNDKSGFSQQLDKLMHSIDVMEDAKDVFSHKLPAFYLQKVMIPKIKSTMNEYIKMFGYDGVILDLTDDLDGLEFGLTIDGIDLPMVALSQFERSLVQFTLKVALADILKISTICFDEPDHAACEGNEATMARVLLKVSERKRTIVISHSTETKNILFGAGAQMIHVVRSQDEDNRTV